MAIGTPIRFGVWAASRDTADSAEGAAIPGVQDGVTKKMPELATKAALDAALIGEGNMPSGGAAHAALVKASASNFDTVWLPLELNVMAFGATGDGETDDTAAIQNAVDAATTAGVILKFPPGTYLITDTITIGQTSGWQLVGDHATIMQDTDDTGIFLITHTTTNSWRIAGFTLDWSNNQAGNANAIAIGFDNQGDDPDAWGHYGFRIEDIRLRNGHQGIGQIDPDEQNPVWGCHINRIHADATWTGPVIVNNNTGAGSPNVRIENIYVIATNITTEVFNFSACRQLEFSNVEVNLATVAPELLALANIGLRVTNYRTEQGTVEGAAFRGIIEATGEITIDGFEILSKTLDPGGGNWMYGVRFPGETVAHIGMLNASDNTLTTGSLGAVDTSSSSSRINVLTPPRGFTSAVFQFDSTAAVTTVNGVEAGRIGVPGGIRFASGSGGATITAGTGSPESAVTANVGSLFLRTDGGEDTTLYVKESGTGNTGWVPI